PLDHDLAGLLVDVDPDVVLGAVAGPRALLDRLLDRLDDDLAVDGLLARDRVGDLQQLEPVGGNAGETHGIFPLSRTSVVGVRIAIAGARRAPRRRVSSARRSAPAWPRRSTQTGSARSRPRPPGRWRPGRLRRRPAGP